jgi:hypothetical protein
LQEKEELKGKGAEKTVVDSYTKKLPGGDIYVGFKNVSNVSTDYI